VAIQDMGAAGLTSSAFEMASSGGTGFRIDVGKVPLREPGLTPYEIMLSESQERMLAIAEKGREGELLGIFERWGLEYATIGELTESGRGVVLWNGKQAADMAIQPLTDQAPMYTRPVAVPSNLERLQAPPEVPTPENPGQALLDLLATPDLASKEWIWRQYDHTVRTNTLAGPGGDAAVLRVKDTKMGLALTTDVNPVYCALDPRRGGAQAVAEAVRNLACVGAEPVGLTDCLNFGNPEIPEIAWQLREAIRGMAEACRTLGVPVVSGNVSLYNTTEDRSVHPTPTVAVVGLIPEVHTFARSAFLAAGDRILLLGKDDAEFGGAAYLRLLYEIEQGRPPAVDLGAEARLAALLRHLSRTGIARTAHDLSEGGLGIALAEACFDHRLGARIQLPVGGAALFSESQGRALVAVPPERADEALRTAEEAGVPAADLGEVGGDRLVVGAGDGGGFDLPVAEMHEVWSTALPRALE
jgi:phosphoribosylformylglycinamidine synthase